MEKYFQEDVWHDNQVLFLEPTASGAAGVRELCQAGCQSGHADKVNQGRCEVFHWLICWISCLGLRSILELWGWGKSYSELEVSIKRDFPAELMVRVVHFLLNRCRVFLMVCICVFHRKSIREKTILSNLMPVASPKNAAQRDKNGFLMCVLFYCQLQHFWRLILCEYFRDSLFCNLVGVLILTTQLMSFTSLKIMEKIRIELPVNLWECSLVV